MGQRSRRSRRCSPPLHGRIRASIGAHTHTHRRTPTWLALYAFHESDRVDGVVGVGSEKAVDRSAAFTATSRAARRWNNAADRALTLRTFVSVSYLSVRNDGSRKVVDNSSPDSIPSHRGSSAIRGGVKIGSSKLAQPAREIARLIAHAGSGSERPHDLQV